MPLESDSGRFTATDAKCSHALLLVRDIVASLNSVKSVDIDIQAPRPPKLDPEDLNGIIPEDVRSPYDVREVIGRVVDGSEFHEYFVTETFYSIHVIETSLVTAN